MVTTRRSATLARISTIVRKIHRCIPSKCGGPCNNNGQCNQKFPKPLSEITYFDNETGRFVYRRTKPEDQWVVGYDSTECVPTSDFMLGPLSIETKEREKKIRHSLNKDKYSLKEPK
ncbi:hypothetical protein RclHR1_00930012 [Rhizophagus clarus]|uniref:Uncharacterized protein n=1 Tax=Rhizophagus clarus TaxID=94130 RepID=A0A2Z6S405_9GLOM|nr:hypothetical protein RclHR1_00930012 [Rhizophagus clarus]